MRMRRIPHQQAQRPETTHYFVTASQAPQRLRPAARRGGLSPSPTPERWQDGHMVLRWVAAGMGEAAKQFRRVNGYLHLPALRAALDATIAAVTPSKEDAA